MQHPELAEHPDVEYQPDTVSTRGVVWFVAIFIVFGIASQILLWVIYGAMHDVEAQQNVSASAMMAQTVTTPEPRLQPSPGRNVMPWEDLKATQEREFAEFRKRGWVDEKSGNVVIPEDVVKRVSAMSAHGPTTQGANR